MEEGVGTTFGFSLYAVSLQVILVAYFRSKLNELSGLELLEDSKVCYH